MMFSFGIAVIVALIAVEGLVLIDDEEMMIRHDAA
jgi:hypothetical protein